MHGGTKEKVTRSYNRTCLDPVIVLGSAPENQKIGFLYGSSYVLSFYLPFCLYSSFVLLWKWWVPVSERDRPTEIVHGMLN
jgi:hypothetical protein